MGRERALVRDVRRKSAAKPAVIETPRRFRGVVAYDGSAFSGWQRQFAQVGVQELLEVALEEATGLSIQVLAAGRTDAGVHADGQTFSFDAKTALPASALKCLCDHVLPPTLCVLRVDDAASDFGVHRDVVSKLYRYTVRVSRDPSPATERVVWRVPTDLDLSAMQAAALHLVGRHDFRAFRTDPGPARRGEDTVRTVDRVAVTRAHDLIRIDVTGPGFLYMMVRNIAAALVAVGAGRQSADWVAEVLAGRLRSPLPPPAPAAGLCLIRVDYEDGWPANCPPQHRDRPLRRRRRKAKRRAAAATPKLTLGSRK